MDNKIERFNRIFRILAIISIALLIAIIPITSMVRKASVIKQDQIVYEYGKDSEEAKNYEIVNTNDVLYRCNSILCIFVLGYSVVYVIGRIIICKKSNIKIFRKENLKNYIPIILLALFMIWTAFATCMACAEFYAEEEIKNTKEGEEISSFTQNLANFTEADRFDNTLDRAWNGNPRHREGYFTFLLYGAVFVSVLMLGNNSKDIKKWILRAILISSLFMVLATIATLFGRALFNVTFYNRFIFSNRNYFGHLIAILLMMAICMAIIEESKVFKAIAFIDCILFFTVLSTNDTFAMLLGISFGLAFLFIVTLIRFIKLKKVKEFVSCIVIIILFVLITTTFVGSNVIYLKSKGIKYNFVHVYTNFLGKTYCHTINTLSEEKADEYGINEFTYKNELITFGHHVTELENRRDNFFEKEFKKLFSQLSTITNEALDDEDGNDNSEGLLAEEEIEDATDTIGSGRGRLWKMAFRIFNEHPIIGWGLENARDYDKDNGLRSHNIFLQMSITTGLVGATLYFTSIFMIFFGVLFDVKLAKYKTKQLAVILLLILLLMIVLNVVIHQFTDRLLFNYLISYILAWILFTIVFVRKIHLRIKEWNNIEFIGMAVFVSYMINDMFGNSTFYTSPYFVLFIALLTIEKIFKKSYFNEEKDITKEEALADGK